MPAPPGHAAGHKYLYTCAPSNGEHAEEFTIVPVPVPVTDPANPPGRFAYTGYFNLVSVRTNEMAKYGLDLTRAAGPGSTRNCPVPTFTSTDCLGVVDHCVATSVVDDEESPSSPLENATTPSGFIDRWKVTSNNSTVVAAAVPCRAETVRRRCWSNARAESGSRRSARRTKCRGCPASRVHPGTRARTIDGAPSDPVVHGAAPASTGTRITVVLPGRGTPLAEQQRPRTRVPGKAFDVQPARVRFSLAGCGGAKARGAATSRGIRASLRSAGHRGVCSERAPIRPTSYRPRRRARMRR